MTLTNPATAQQNPSQNAELQSNIIELIKQNSKVQQLLAKHPPDHYDTTIEQVDLGGHCGFVGCDWHKLVSIVITAKRSNRPSINLLIKVSGQTPQTEQKPKLEFVELHAMNDNSWHSLSLEPNDQ